MHVEPIYLEAFQHIVNSIACLFDFDFVSLEKRHHDICVHVPRLVLSKYENPNVVTG